MHNTDYFICENQELLFANAQKLNFDDNEFVEKYMNSRLCNKEMDTPYSYFHYSEPEDIMDYLLKEIQVKTNTKHYDANAMRWVGYMYRYIYLKTKIPSSVIYAKLPLKDMLVYYVGMHTQDNDYFLDVIKDKLRKDT